MVHERSCEAAFMYDGREKEEVNLGFSRCSVGNFSSAGPCHRIKIRNF